ncbi:MAG: hydroxymethylbilane synthase, partial [candidate division Zixibacteria bacterium]|nr:hydroxymethylbilane synthase [candidate division Zixibacteria bacterium]
LFTKEIELALLEADIDLAVHSLKDLPTTITSGLCLGAALKREETEDVLISKDNLKLEELPSGAKIGTSSLRRKAQLLFYRKDFKIVDIRGNIDTRLKKLETQNLDGLIMAKAGVLRLGFSKLITQTISTDIILPAVGQGALAVEIREGDGEIKKMTSFLNHSSTFTAVTCERSFLRTLEGGCQVPIGALAQVQEDKISHEGMIASLDGKTLFREKISGKTEEAEKLGEALAKRLLELGGKKILEDIRGKYQQGYYV